ncbi:outer membrane lipoprotein-sorting protein [Kiritimatiellota bacterium B12222]|nr:outer membrane lipoprotein-sorting protein [Kiritimatiellota bacterium B12222]
MDKDDQPLPSGPELMAQVQAQLPPMALQMNGFVRTRQKRQQQDRRLVTVLRFGDPIPMATYTLSDNFGEPITQVQVSWLQGQPHFQQWDAEGVALPVPSPEDEVIDTGLTWSDMSLDFLWWPGAKALERDIVKTRSSVVLEIEAPPGRDDVDMLKLWVDERALFIVRAEFYDAEGELLRRIEVDKIKKVNEELWMVQDLMIYDRVNGRHIGIRFDEVIELDEAVYVEPVMEEMP